MRGKLTVGDEVRVSNRRRVGPGKDYAGKVTRVGRIYATAEYETTRTDWRGEEVTSQHIVEFDMETGHEKGYSHYGILVRTLEQAALDSRQRAARDVLHAAGVTLSCQRRYALEQVEALAEVAATFADPDAEQSP